VVNLDTLTTVPKQLLAERVAVLSPGRVRAIDSAIAFALGPEV
jgi:mRNA-degrading endonuclease toxin of MazEF toxin-antitoxin module